MIDVIYLPSFIRQYEKLDKALQDEVDDKIDLFINGFNNQSLKTHKLHGRLKDRWSFSVNYKVRIVFKYVSKKEAAFLAIGDHDIYN